MRHCPCNEIDSQHLFLPVPSPDEAASELLGHRSSIRLGEAEAVLPREDTVQSNGPVATIDPLLLLKRHDKQTLYTIDLSKQQASLTSQIEPKYAKYA